MNGLDTRTKANIYHVGRDIYPLQNNYSYRRFPKILTDFYYFGFRLAKRLGAN